MDEFGTWQNINRPPKALIFDAKTPFLFVLCIYFPNWFTVGLVLLAVSASAYANHKGVSISHLVRMLKVYLWRGRRMIARPRARYTIRM